MIEAASIVVQASALALFFADYFIGLGLPGTAILAVAVFAWGFRAGWRSWEKRR